MGGIGLSVRKSGHHVVYLHKIKFLFKWSIQCYIKVTLKAFVERAFNRLFVALPRATERHSSGNLLSADGGSIQQQSIHHEWENTMPFLSICVANGQSFLRPSIIWWQICQTDYQTLFEQHVFHQQMYENKCLFALKNPWCFQYSISLLNSLVLSCEWMIWSICVVVCKILLKNGQEWKILGWKYQKKSKHMSKLDFQTITELIIYKQQFLHSDWLRTCQLIPN